LCLRGKPACERCPLSNRCIALTTDRTAQLPVRKPKKAVPEKTTVMLVVSEGREVLLQQRPDSGIWGGLLSLPELPLHTSAQEFGASVELTMQAFGDIAACRKLQDFSHVFTHFKLHVSPYQVVLKQRFLQAAESVFVWYPVDALTTAPLPAPVKKLLLGLFASDDLLRSQDL